MASEASGASIGTMRDGAGRLVAFGVAGGTVKITVTPHSGHHGRIVLDTAGRREEYARLLNEACQAAGSEPPALAAPAAAQAPGDR